MSGKYLNIHKDRIVPALLLILAAVLAFRFVMADILPKEVIDPLPADEATQQVANPIVHRVQSKFPRPQYDSGWVEFQKGETKELKHNLGGDVDRYVVDMQFRDPNERLINGGGINQMYYGAVQVVLFDKWNREGAYWRLLNGSSIFVTRLHEDASAKKIRIRIWIYD